MRPAQKVSISVKDIGSDPGIEFRILEVTHSFSTSGGYSCFGRAVRTCVGEECRRKEKAAKQPNAESIIDRLDERAESEQKRRPQST